MCTKTRATINHNYHRFAVHEELCDDVARVLIDDFSIVLFLTGGIELCNLRRRFARFIIGSPPTLPTFSALPAPTLGHCLEQYVTRDDRSEQEHSVIYSTLPRTHPPRPLQLQKYELRCRSGYEALSGVFRESLRRHSFWHVAPKPTLHLLSIIPLIVNAPVTRLITLLVFLKMPRAGN